MYNSPENIRQCHAQCELIQPHSILMMIGDEESCFYFTADREHFITLPVGFGLVSARFFKHTPPTPDDIEYAINYIEDEIERIVPAIPGSYALFSSDAFIRRIAGLCGVADSPVMRLSRDKLETLFGQYAEISMGRPPRSHETDITAIFYAKLLIFREYMHHLKFDHITVIE